MLHILTPLILSDYYFDSRLSLKVFIINVLKSQRISFRLLPFFERTSCQNKNKKALNKMQIVFQYVLINGNWAKNIINEH